jgi:Ca2+-binding EF-hand superfamily protein
MTKKPVCFSFYGSYSMSHQDLNAAGITGLMRLNPACKYLRSVTVKLMMQCLAFAGLLVSTTVVVAQSKPAAPAQQPANIEQGIDQMFAALDRDKNKQLSFEEFKNGVVAERKQAMLMQRLGNIFQDADKNRNGSLEPVEFNALPGMKAAKEPKPKFGDFDANKDQKLSFREYLGFVSAMSQPPKQ